MSVKGLYPPQYPVDLSDIASAVEGTRFHEVLNPLYRPKQDVFILEAGSGTGKLGMFYAVHGCNVTLIDIDEEQIKRSVIILTVVEAVLKRRLSVTFRIGDAKALPYLDNTFSLVFSEGVVEHWVSEERLKYLREMVRVSRECVAVAAPSAESEGSMRRCHDTQLKFPTMQDKEHPMTETELHNDLTAAGLRNITVRSFEMMPNIGFVIGVGVK